MRIQNSKYVSIFNLHNEIPRFKLVEIMERKPF